jgi:predicted secreted protein
MVTWRRGAGRYATLTLLALLALPAACSKSTPGPVVIPGPTTPPPTSTSTPATATVTPSASLSPTPTKSPTAKPTPTATAKPSVAPSVQVSESSGSTKSLTVGQTMSLRLPQATDGGATWIFQTKPDPAILTVVSDETLLPSPTPVSGTVGANGTHRWVFQAVGAGTTSFTVNEEGPGAGAPTISTYSLTVAVSH